MQNIYNSVKSGGLKVFIGAGRKCRRIKIHVLGCRILDSSPEGVEIQGPINFWWFCSCCNVWTVPFNWSLLKIEMIFVENLRKFFDILTTLGNRCDHSGGVLGCRGSLGSVLHHWSPTIFTILTWPTSLWRYVVGSKHWPSFTPGSPLSLLAVGHRWPRESI